MKQLQIFLLLTIVSLSSLIGQTWQSTNGATPAHILAFATHNTYWYCATYAGVFQSNDNGQNWTSVLDAYYSTDIKVIGNRIWVANYEGLRYSDDEGATWTFSQVTTGYDVSTIATHNNQVWVGTKGDGAYYWNGTNWISANNGLFNADHKFLMQIIEHKGNLYAAGGYNIYKYDDNTNTWDSLGKANSGLPYPAGHSTICSDGTNLYTAVYGWGFYYSIDDGITWTQYNNGLFNMSTNAIIKMIVHNNVIWAGGGTGLYKNTYPFTNNWQNISANEDVYAMYSDNSLLVAGKNYVGFSFSQDNGTTWTTNNNGLTDFITKVVTDGTNVYATGIGSGVSFYNTATNWIPLNNTSSITSPGAYTVTSHNNKLYLSLSGDRQVYRSNNNGASWTHIPTNLPYQHTAYLIKGEGTHIYGYFSDKSFYRSDNEGASWIKVGLDGYTIEDFCFDNANIWAVTDSGVFYSTDLGVSWTYKGLYDKLFSDIVYTNGRIIASTSDEGIYISDDNGLTWTQSNAGLTSNQIFCLYANGNFILAGSVGYGIAYSSDKGTTWADINNGLANYYISSITMQGNEAYIGTMGGGVWKANMSLILSKENELKPSNISIYPNPTQHQISILSKKNILNATLSLKDIQGKVVYLQDISLLQNQTQSIYFDLSAGIYLLEIEADGDKEVKKLIVE